MPRSNSLGDFDVITGPAVPSRPIPPASLPQPPAAEPPPPSEVPPRRPAERNRQ